MYLAIGFTTLHNGFCGSRAVSSTDPQEVANKLNKEFGIWFEQILLTKNDNDGPVVIHHWNLDRDFHE